MKKIITAFLICLGFISFLTNQHTVFAAENEKISNEGLETELVETLDPKMLEVFNRLDDYTTTDDNGITVFDSNEAISNNESTLLIEIGNTVNGFGEEPVENKNITMRALSWPKITLYGNFCGPAGKSGNNWSKKAIDDLDFACKKHDRCYVPNKNINQKCNKAFLVDLLPIMQKTKSNPLSKKSIVAHAAYYYFQKEIKNS